MQDIPALLGIVAALAVGVVSPGPSFVLVARTSVSASRAAGVAAALGMGIGGVVYAVAALLGLQGLLLAVPAFYLALKLVGGVYLVCLGIRIWRAADMPLVQQGRVRARSRSMFSALSLGFATQVGNPKTAIVYASVFAAFLPAAQTVAFDLALVAIVFTIESSWYSVVALVLSSERARAGYLRHKAMVDRAAGAVMVALGLKLMSTAGRA
jgi:threonine/homoserine/homoserine lactone efflux protein